MYFSLLDLFQFVPESWAENLPRHLMNKSNQNRFLLAVSGVVLVLMLERKSEL